jgi:glycosyltransferase involved in cell wall biosynthesis
LLLINKFYHDKGHAGGVGRYLVQEEEDLSAAGWDVIPFAMADADARPSVWERYFVRARDYSEARYGGSTASDALSLIWNREAARKLDALLTETRPDVAHLHNIYHHLSPSILPVLKRHGIPVVMTLHDLRLLCPAIHMLRQGQVCEKCKGGRLHQAVLGKCVKDSRGASLLAAVETAHQKWRGLYTNGVQSFLCPSRFYLQKFREWGYPAAKLVHLPNFVDLEFWNPAVIPAEAEQDAYIYFGRISREKGLRYVLEAQKLWEDGHRTGRIAEAPLKLLVAGTGPCAGNLQAKAAMLKLETIEMLGPLGIDELRRQLGRARFSVLPSIWYENGPMAALESLAAGIPLVGSSRGGIPEMITEGVTGFVTAPGDPVDILRGLLAAYRQVPDRPAVRAWAEQHASRVRHMERLDEILARAVGAR